MKTRSWGRWAGGMLLATTLGLAGCGDDDDPGAAPTQQVDPDPLTLEIQSAVVPEFASTAQPTVRFRVLASGAPIDLEAEMAASTTFPRTAGPRFTLAMVDPDGDRRSYYEASRAAADYTFEAPNKPAPRTRTQATSPATTRASIRRVGERTYEFTFPSTGRVTTGLDRTRTHVVAGWIERRNQGADSDVAAGSFDFVPSGNAPVDRDEVVVDAACNRCHGQLQAHGVRRTVQLCMNCHSQQSGDPETDRTVDFKVMIHKIHSGRDLPSVQQGVPYFIVGFGGAVHDYSEAAFPWHDHGVRHCTVCHTGGQDSASWRTRPSLAACSSCHDNVKFSGSFDPCPVGTAAVGNTKDCLHAGGAIAVSNPSAISSCTGCHGPGTAAAVDKYHHGD